MLLLVALPVLAQNPDAKARAWEIYRIGHDRLTDQAPQLVAELVRQRHTLAYESHDPDTTALVQITLDALIQLDATVESGVLLEYLPRHQPEVLVLLALHPKEHQSALLALQDELQDGAAWLAVRNLLAETKAPGFAARLLKETKYRLSVTVTDPNQRGGAFGGGEGGGGAGCGVRGFPRGFPPGAVYSLKRNPLRGDVLLAPGPSPIYYRRTVIPTDRQIGWDSVLDMIDKQRAREEYLKSMLPRIPGETFTSYTSLVWAGEETFVSQLQAAAGEQARLITAMTARLLELQWFTCAEAGALRLPVEIELHDMRAGRGPLPAPAQVAVPPPLCAPSF
ncbi:MAG: hypothetical protein ABI693_06625 [Bryobacteraceae bacterium]